MNYHFSECLDVSRQPREGDDCEFTVADDPNHAGQLMATRYIFSNYVACRGRVGGSTSHSWFLFRALK